MNLALTPSFTPSFQNNSFLQGVCPDYLGIIWDNRAGEDLLPDINGISERIFKNHLAHDFLNVFVKQAHKSTQIANLYLQDTQKALGKALNSNNTDTERATRHVINGCTRNTRKTAYFENNSEEREQFCISPLYT